MVDPTKPKKVFDPLEDVNGLLSAGASLLGDTVSAFSNTGTNDMKDTAKGRAIGGGIGAAVGSVVPVVGTALGQQLGSMVGGLVGGKSDRRRMERNNVERLQGMNDQLSYDPNVDPYGYMEDGGVIAGADLEGLPASDEMAYQQPVMINIERGELMVGGDGKVIAHFENPNAYQPHANSRDEEHPGNFVVLPEGAVIIPKKSAKLYLDGDDITRRSIMMEVIKNQQNKGQQPQFGDGGKVAYNPNLATKDNAFQTWYRTNTLEGKNGIPYSDRLSYDYYSFYRNGDYQNKDFNIEDHFPDTYKRPSHPTFSNESIYSTPENPGGRWEGEKYIPAKVQKMNDGGVTGDPPGKRPAWAQAVSEEQEKQELASFGNDLRFTNPFYNPRVKDKGPANIKNRAEGVGELRKRDMAINAALEDNEIRQEQQKTNAHKEKYKDYYSRMDRKPIEFKEDNYSNDEPYNYNADDVLTLKTGKFNLARVPKPLIDDAYNAATQAGLDPMDFLALIGQESTFGGGLSWTSRGRRTNKRNLVSGWNVTEQYQPKAFDAFLADRKVPGVEVQKNNSGYRYYVADENAALQYLEKNPNLYQEYDKMYNETLAKVPKTIDPFLEAAKWVKQKGIQSYNPGDPKYETMVKESRKLLENDPVLQEYLQQRNKSVAKMANGGITGIPDVSGKPRIDPKTIAAYAMNANIDPAELLGDDLAIDFTGSDSAYAGPEAPIDPGTGGGGNASRRQMDVGALAKRAGAFIPGAIQAGMALQSDPNLKPVFNQGFDTARSHINQMPTMIGIDDQLAEVESTLAAGLDAISNANTPSARAEAQNMVAQAAKVKGEIIANRNRTGIQMAGDKLGRLAQNAVAEGSNNQAVMQNFQNEQRMDNAARRNILGNAASEAYTNMAMMENEDTAIEMINAMSRFVNLDPLAKQKIIEDPGARDYINNYIQERMNAGVDVALAAQEAFSNVKEGKHKTTTINSTTQKRGPYGQPAGSQVKQTEIKRR
jgi:hypothetical protein